MSRIALGIVGAGRIVRQAYLMILPLIECIGEVLLYDLDRSKADAVIEAYDSWLLESAFAKEHGHQFEDAQNRAARLRRKLSVSMSLDDVVRRSDAVLVSTPPSSHLQIAQACLDAGALTLIEKPLAVSSIAAREFAHRNKSLLERVRYLENYVHNPAFQRVKRMIDDGTFGSPLLISVFLSKTLPTGSSDSWRLNPLESGGGVLSDWGSHTFGLALYLAGQGCKVISVRAESVHFIPRSCPPVESYALTSIFTEAKSGRPLTLLVENSWECGMEKSAPSGFWVSIALTGGTIRIDQKLTGGTKEYFIRAARHDAEAISTRMPSEFTHDSFYYSLLDSFQPRPSPYASFSFGLKILDIIDESRYGEYSTRSEDRG
jgi:predicted dehydrogenase